jgi:hypothetical protein
MATNYYVKEGNFIILLSTKMKEDKYAYMTCQLEPGTNLVFAEYARNLKVDLKIAKEMVAHRMVFTENKPHYVVIDISNVKEVTAEAKEYMQHPEGGLKNILGAAFIANNPVAELLANIYVKTPIDFEAKFFRKKEDAINWIKGYMNRKDKLPIPD